MSVNDIAGVKYCPGGGLPTFEYSEYKPRCSKTERTRFIYRGDEAKDVYETGRMEGVPGVHGDGGEAGDHDVREGGAQAGGDVLGDGYGIPQEEEAIPTEQFAKLTIRELIADWNARDNVPEQEGGGGEAVWPRRKSDRFIQLSSVFEGQDSGAQGGTVLEHLPVDLKQQKPSFKNFSEVTGWLAGTSLGANQNLKITNQEKVCVVRKGVQVRDGKRERDDELEVSNFLPVLPGRHKKVKVSPGSSNNQ